MANPIEVLLKEKRRFKPPKDFATRAVAQANIYKEAQANPDPLLGEGSQGARLVAQTSWTHGPSLAATSGGSGTPSPPARAPSSTKTPRPASRPGPEHEPDHPADPPSSVAGAQSRAAPIR